MEDNLYRPADDVDSRLAQAESRLETIRALYRAAIDRAEALADFIEAINIEANAQYYKHRWCEEYIEVLDRLNEAAPHGITLKRPSRKFHVDVRLSAHVEIVQRLEVMAADEDNARDIVSEMIADNAYVVDSDHTRTMEEILSDNVDWWDHITDSDGEIHYCQQAD